MNDQDKQKIKLAIANSFLQTATVQQSLAILQEKALERADEEISSMDDKALEEVLTNIRAQEIATELRAEQSSEGESAADESSTEPEAVAEDSE